MAFEYSRFNIAIMVLSTRIFLNSTKNIRDDVTGNVVTGSYHFVGLDIYKVDHARNFVTIRVPE